ncbi:DNA replication protein DnaC [Planomicrobium sp. HSC-17F08]|uniref:ATP-binding protein n=1 Tax=Planococcus glaciei TaxID=459472 RepID=A0A7H8QAX3_9BACL|nr:IS21-like element helper ATPase IstB [Planococcus glaciei]MCP2033598.1 DNA replication protein DnaC [Planomicrobium sp. HSC-17F08]QDY45793.1 ATP-binding protein [Planococcus glaciei]QKX51030.1 ATP-binding protein [Planococcus glaciei]
MSHPFDALQQQCRTLRLAETAKELPALLRKAEAKGWTYHEFTHELLSYELQCREQKTTERLMKWAEFPELKTLDTYDLKEQNALGEKQFNVLKELNWVEEDFTLILMGPTGAGKTHLSVALGVHAVQQGFQVSFVSMAHLMYILKTKEHIKKSNTRYKRIIGSDLIIIDDVMYMTYEAHEAHLFFQFIYDLYDKAAFILTSNKGPNEWGKFLGDPTLTTAILDRLLHRSEIITFGEETDSIRMKYRKTLFPETNGLS